ncbi:MAG: BatA domain-containing protein [Candidatus Eisenbacteria bacterium]|nr:BatA domain-containing protein [Candidatus Eisenbacteria bacterium]
MLRFGEPGVLWGLLAIPALAFVWLWADRRRRRDLDRWIGRELWPRLIADRSEAVRTASAALLLLSLFLLLLGAARPQLGSRVLETRQRGIDVVLAVDVSLSMEARDIAPSREERAR